MGASCVYTNVMVNRIMKNTLFIIFTLSVLNGFSQIFDDMEIENDSLIKPWIESDINNYEGVYFYGISEGESIVTLAIENDKIDLQVSNSGSEIYYNGQFAGWERNIENYTNISINGNKFYSDQSDGEFVTYKGIKCLKLEKPPIDLYDEKYELGEINRKPKETYFSGNYISTKFELLNSQKLQSVSLQELKIMRNEIFARYGYKFKDGGQMNEYFKNQDWYTTSNLDINNCLTTIEKANIEIIKKIEKEKKP